ncbi:MAG: adenylyl-sulfate kinase [Candidatus Rokubacteria bacterium]|nr:adenylyl-sulfate kinase [Candidatus Rokubacteria bacterium]
MSWAIWITGLPGSGKSVLAGGAMAALRAQGEPVAHLELDVIRRTLTPSPTYSETERDVVYRALVFMATALTGVGVPVIIDATAHRRAWRELARRSIARFAEVQLVCPVEVCQRREQRRTTGNAPRGIYARAGGPGAQVPGVDVPYEPSFAPERVIDTAKQDVGASVREIVALAQRLGGAAEPTPRIPGGGWAIWITGLPGSGKTTLACAAARALAGQDMPIQVLELAGLREFLLNGRPESDATREIVHRALAYTAKLMTEAGVAVIVDATAPRRAWRELARGLIVRFAEVQLLCPPELCAERERSARWQLGGCRGVPPSARAGRRTEIVLDYEPSLRPELTLHTDRRDVESAVEEILRLARRLHRTGAVGEYRT